LQIVTLFRSEFFQRHVSSIFILPRAILYVLLDRGGGKAAAGGAAFDGGSGLWVD
jgi:hypothetical protein